jgi:hypothetical protein
MKRILCLFLIVIVIASVFPTAVFADESLNQAVAAKVGQLEEIYGISVAYPLTKSGSSAIALNSLEIMEGALATVTPSVVRQVSAYYYEKLGHRLTFEYSLTSKGLNATSESIAVAGFQPATGSIYLFLPTSSAYTVMTGDNPISIVHEFGHALHYMIMDSYGEEKLRSEWVAMNQGVPYTSVFKETSPDDRTFITSYAATKYEEDFAEVLGHCFIRNKAGQGFTGQLSVGGARTSLGQKVAYMDALLARYFPNDAQMLANFRKTLNAPTRLTYQGMNFNGSHLQFIGYPQPRYVLDGCLNVLEKERESAIWIREIGGWYVCEPNGNELLIFPTLLWANLPDSFEPPIAA